MPRQHDFFQTLFSSSAPPRLTHHSQPVCTFVRGPEFEPQAASGVTRVPA